MRKVFLLKNLTYILIIFCFLLASGCKAMYNNNGWSVWGWSKSTDKSELHIGFVSTDFFFQNAEKHKEFGDKKEGVRLEDTLKEELGFGTLGIFKEKRF